MSWRTNGMAVLLVQVALVLSIAGKYAWERHAEPRVWTRTAQFDPEQPLRGRYLALSLQADACGLPLAEAEQTPSFSGWKARGRSIGEEGHDWKVATVARQGTLAAVLSPASRPEEALTLRLNKGAPCSRAVLLSNTEFFVSEHASSPFPLAKGDELWAEVTVPEKGPPRPIQLAISNSSGFHVLNLR